MTLMTGMSIFGKMSTRIVTTDRTPATAINSASTTKVYGRRRASRTIHIGFAGHRDKDGTARSTAKWSIYSKRSRLGASEGADVVTNAHGRRVLAAVNATPHRIFVHHSRQAG